MGGTSDARETRSCAICISIPKFPYVPTLTAAAALCVTAALSKAAWWLWYLTYWPWKWCPSQTWATTVPILVFLGVSVLNLGSPQCMRHTEVRQTDVRHKHRLMPQPIRWDSITCREGSPCNFVMLVGLKNWYCYLIIKNAEASLVKIKSHDRLYKRILLLLRAHGWNVNVNSAVLHVILNRRVLRLKSRKNAMLLVISLKMLKCFVKNKKSHFNV